jgi:hypothetical protein
MDKSKQVGFIYIQKENGTMKTRTYLLVIALLGFSVVLLPQEVVCITPNTYNLFVGEANIGTCVTGSEALTLTNDTGGEESFDNFTVTLSGVGFPAEENSDLDGVLDSTDNFADSTNGIDGENWGKGEIGVILLIIFSFILLGL